jgi:hypothetical protein
MIKTIQRSEYKKFWLENKGTIFQDPDWLELVLIDGQELVFYGFFSNFELTNCFAAVFVRGRFFSHVTLPLLTPHLGWVLNFLNDELIIQTLRKENPDSIYYSVPTDNDYWLKLPTHTINLNDDVAFLFKNLRKDKQRSIKKGEKMKLKVAFDKDSIRLISLVKKTFERQQREFSGYLQIDKIVSNYPNCFQVSILDDHLELASLLFVYDTKKCYYLIGGFNTTADNNFAGPFGMWNGILTAKELTLEFFDFEGSIVPSIADYFKSFGSSPASYSMFNEKKILYKIFEKIK